MKKYVKSKTSVELKRHQKKDNILEFNQYMKSDKMPNIIYADNESLIKKINGFVNNPDNSSSKKKVTIIFADVQC